MKEVTQSAEVLISPPLPAPQLAKLHVIKNSVPTNRHLTNYHNSRGNSWGIPCHYDVMRTPRFQITSGDQTTLESMHTMHWGNA